MTARLYCGDCLDVLPTLDAESVDAVVCDPPYGLSFMGKDWDHGVPGIHFWQEIARVAKPGAHLVAFGGTRTHHRLMCAIEDAGWEIRDVLMWLYGSGFPKSLDVGKAIDKAAGAERERVPATGGLHANRNMNDDGWKNIGADEPMQDSGIPVTDAARQWDGWGTALKPAWEPIILARKPLIGTVAANVQRYGTGALNVDGCRIGTTVETWPASRNYSAKEMSRPGSTRADDARTEATGPVPAGRWPANLALDEDAAAMLGDTSRFFYVAKASRAERGEDNTHPTVKPVALMRWLCRLVTPPNGMILDPFMGSGTTGIAALNEGLGFLGIEKTPEYVPIARDRIGPMLCEVVE